MVGILLLNLISGDYFIDQDKEVAIDTLRSKDTEIL